MDLVMLVYADRALISYKICLHFPYFSPSLLAWKPQGYTKLIYIYILPTENGLFPCYVEKGKVPHEVPHSKNPYDGIFFPIKFYFINVSRVM